MTTSARLQLVLGFSAAFAAYLLLIVYNGGRIDLSSFKPAEHTATIPAPTPTPMGAQRTP